MSGLPPYSLAAHASIDAIVATGILKSSKTVAAWFADIDALIDAQVVPYAPEYGAKADAIKLIDGTIVAGSLSTLNSASASFNSLTDVGKVIAVQGAGISNNLTVYNSVCLSNNALTTTIAAVLSPTSVTLTTAATNPVSGQVVVYGTDDTAALQKCLDVAKTRGGVSINGGLRSYLIRDTLALYYGKQEIFNCLLFQVDTGSSTYGGVASTFNYSQVCSISLNSSPYGSTYIGPAYPTGRTYSSGYYTGSNLDWGYGFSVHDNIIDCSAVSYGYPGQVTSRLIGDAVIGGNYVGNAKVVRNRIINGQTGAVSLRACFGCTIDDNTIENLRCIIDVSGNVWGGNALQIFTAYPGAVDSYTVETGANQVTNNKVYGSPTGAAFPGTFVPSGQNAMLCANLGIDVQSGGRVNGIPNPWANSTTFNAGDRVLNNNNSYVCTVGGQSAASGSGPSGTAPGVAIIDGTVTWQAAISGHQWVCSSPSSLKSYALNAVVNNNGNTYLCVGPGQSALASTAGGAAPIGPTGTGTNIQDGFFASTGAWVSGATYTAGQTAQSGTLIYNCTTGGTASTAPTGTTTFTDGSLVWAYVGPVGALWNYTYGGPMWTQGTAFNFGQKIYNGSSAYQCTTPGISAASGNGPAGNGAYIVDGTVVWQNIKSYMRPIPQAIVTGNMVRRCFCGIMIEGQRIGGAGDALVSSNDVADCMQGIIMYTDMIDFGTVDPWANGYGTLISGNKVSRCLLLPIACYGEAFKVSDNLVLDWGICSTNLNKLGYSATFLTVSRAIAIFPSSPDLLNYYAGSVEGNSCLMHTPFDPNYNFFTHAGISAATLIDNQVWRFVSIKNNSIDFGSSYRQTPPAWAASANYVFGAYVSKGGYIYQCMAPGQSGTTGPTGTSFTALVVDGGVSWQYIGGVPTYASAYGIQIQGMMDDCCVHDNTIARCPAPALLVGSRRTLAAWSLTPQRFSFKDNSIVDCNLAAANPGYAMTIMTNGRPGYLIEDNTIYDSGVVRLSGALNMPQEITGVDNLSSDILIRRNRVKGGTSDGYTFRIFSAGTNVKLEQNDSYNYAAALPLISNYAGNLYAGTVVWNTAPAAGAALGWVVNVSGKVPSAAWVSGATYAVNNLVSSSGNTYKCTAGGVAASAPTGTTSFVDGNGVAWTYVSPVPTFSSMGFVEPPPAVAAAAGTTLATATVLTKGSTNVTSGTGGVKPPAVLLANDPMFVLNSTGSAINFYPGAAGSSINALAAGAPISIPAGATAVIKAFSPTLLLVNL